MQTPHSVITAYANKQITREDLIKTLSNWEYAPMDTTDDYDSLLVHPPGTINEIAVARRHGLIDGYLYDTILDEYERISLEKSANKQLKEFRLKKVDILKQGDILMLCGMQRKYDAFNVVKENELFQDAESQEFINSLIPEENHWLAPLEDYVEEYSPSIVADLEIYFALKKGIPLKTVADYLENKLTYSESKQIVSQLFILNGLIQFSLEESLDTVAATMRNPETAKILKTRNDQENTIFKALETVLPKHVNDMLRRANVNNRFITEVYKRILELDF